MNWNDLLAAFALYLVIEGMLPFLSPGGWRRSLAMLAGLSDQGLRLFGLGSMVLGLVLLAAVRGMA